MSKQKKNSKRILSVSIRRMVDDSPDTSHLGKYGNRPETDYAIDRAHLEDCETQTPDINFPKHEEMAFVSWSQWNGSAKDALERVRLKLEESSSPNDGTDIKQALDWDEAIGKAIETVWELEKDAGECDCNVRLDRREYRYFNGPVENYLGESPENIRKYVRQDYDRMESLNAGNWCYLGIRAEAKVQVTGDTVQRISSGGLWGVESDSDRSYFDEVQKDELSNLKSELLALGFSKRAIATAFKNVEEKEE